MNSPAQLVAFLVVEGVLPLVEGREPTDAAPVKARPMPPELSAELQLPPGGLAMYYPVAETNVLAHLTAQTSSFWFSGGDYEAGPKALEDALSARYSTQAEARDGAHPENKAMRTRALTLEAAPGRFAVIEMTIGQPWAQGEDRVFFVRVSAQQREQAPAGAGGMF